MLNSKIFNFVETTEKATFIITETLAFIITPCVAVLFSKVLGLVFEIIIIVVAFIYIIKFGTTGLSSAFKSSVTSSSPKVYYDKEHHAHNNEIDMDSANKKD